MYFVVKLSSDTTILSPNIPFLLSNTNLIITSYSIALDLPLSSEGLVHYFTMISKSDRPWALDSGALSGRESKVQPPNRPGKKGSPPLRKSLPIKRE